MREQILNLAQEVTGAQNVDKAVTIALESYLEQKIAEYKQVAKGLIEKYGVGFSEFKEMLGTQLALTWEHEKDYMDWEEAVTNLEYFESTLERLKAYA
jgi:translation initiation factor 2 alpha subunit (eIF-2alpha)